MSLALSVAHSGSSRSERSSRKWRRFLPGKIPPRILERSVFPYLGRRSNRVIVGPGIGRDAAIVRFGASRVLAFSTDPITGAIRRIGRHAVHVNANDVAVAGARPLWFLCTILVPPGSGESDLKLIMREIHREARRLGVAVVRGHTEATPGLQRPIVAGFMVGESRTGRFFTANGGRAGDRVMMTKSAGVEGTAVLAADHAKHLERHGVDKGTIRKAERFSDRISIVREAAIAAKIDGVTAMHDPTEGGVINGLWELAEASHIGIKAEGDQIPVENETRLLCKALGLDPLKLMGSGCLLIACRPTKAPKLLRSLGVANVEVREVGRLTMPRNERLICRNGSWKRLVPIYRDELYSV